MRSIVPFVLLALVACAAEPTTCAPEGFGCNDCLDGTYTCVFDDIEVTSPGCGGCQTQREVYDAVCASGRDLPLAEVDPELTCDRVGD